MFGWYIFVVKATCKKRTSALDDFQLVRWGRGQLHLLSGCKSQEFWQHFLFTLHYKVFINIKEYARMTWHMCNIQGAYILKKMYIYTILQVILYKSATWKHANLDDCSLNFVWYSLPHRNKMMFTAFYNACSVSHHSSILFLTLNRALVVYIFVTLKCAWCSSSQRALCCALTKPSLPDTLRDMLVCLCVCVCVYVQTAGAVQCTE